MKTNKKYSDVALSYLKLGMAIEETTQTFIDFIEQEKSIRSRYRTISWILFRLGLL